jgi:hypothetical protein
MIWEKEASITSYVKCVYGVCWTVKMEHAVFFRIGHAKVDSLGASGYPALQTFLSHILDNRNRSFLLSSKKMFFVLLTAMTVEMLEEVF